MIKLLFNGTCNYAGHDSYFCFFFHYLQAYTLTFPSKKNLYEKDDLKTKNHIIFIRKMLRDEELVYKMKLIILKFIR